MKVVASALKQLEADVAVLKRQLPSWDTKTSIGGRKHREAAQKILVSARTLEKLVRENTFGYP